MRASIVTDAMTASKNAKDVYDTWWCLCEVCVSVHVCVCLGTLTHRCQKSTLDIVLQEFVLVLLSEIGSLSRT